MDLEPDLALAVKVKDAAGGAGHVHVDRARVVDVGGDLEGEPAAGGDVEDGGARGTGAELVARHGLGADVGDGAVVLVVGRAADLLPVGAADAVGRDARDGVWECVLVLGDFVLRGGYIYICIYISYATALREVVAWMGEGGRLTVGFGDSAEEAESVDELHGCGFKVIYLMIYS